MNADPTAEQVAEMTMLAAEAVCRFGITPRVALLSHSNFGSSELPSAQKMRAALDLVRMRNPDFPVDGEMQADTALSHVVLEGLDAGFAARGVKRTFLSCRTSMQPISPTTRCE